MQQTPAEVEALFRDLLIGVTNFFRDPEAFEALEEQVIPQLFAGKPAGAVIRVWSPGCSTGEEAYSIAILLQERMEALKQSFKVQVFATDIDSRAIDTGPRRPLSGQHRRRRLAGAAGALFRPGARRRQPTASTRGIRDMLVFSEQDVIKDPPFSKLDLISCRNLLIYMGAELQKKLIPLFHYALNPGGLLFLGTSETVGEFGDLFAALDRKAKLYQRKEMAPAPRAQPLGPISPPVTPGVGSPAPPAGKRAATRKLPLRELTEQALLASSSPRPARSSTTRATSSTSTAAPACTWNRPRARPA